MRNEAKKIYGTNVFGIVAMLHQLRRWLAIRDLRSRWNDSRDGLVICRKFSQLSHHADCFQVQQHYCRIRLYTKAYQQRGVI
ncbi:hypothetical protein ABN222_06090 [Providencia alcalifaciens]